MRVLLVFDPCMARHRYFQVLLCKGHAKEHSSGLRNFQNVAELAGASSASRRTTFYCYFSFAAFTLLLP